MWDDLWMSWRAKFRRYNAGGQFGRLLCQQKSYRVKSELVSLSLPLWWWHHALPQDSVESQQEGDEHCGCNRTYKHKDVYDVYFQFSKCPTWPLKLQLPLKDELTNEQSASMLTSKPPQLWQRWKDFLLFISQFWYLINKN